MDTPFDELSMEVRRLRAKVRRLEGGGDVANRRAVFELTSNEADDNQPTRTGFSKLADAVRQDHAAHNAKRGNLREAELETKHDHSQRGSEPTLRPVWRGFERGC